MDSSLMLLALASCVFTAHAAVHEETLFYSCSESGDGQVQLHWDGDQITYADFKKQHAVWTAPLLKDLETAILSWFFHLALDSRTRCEFYLDRAVRLDNSSMTLKAPAVVIYPMDEAETGKNNTIYCHIRNFYPPSNNVTWTRNGIRVTEGVNLSNPYPQTDGTFNQLASFSFQPQSDDVVECSVQHQALSRPLITAWTLPMKPARSAAAWVCLSLGLLCIALGVIIFIISAKESLRHKLSDFWRAAYQRVAG
ncbi:RLA class II histocompatibility antigen, DP alpha-1 chain-like [Oreochromis aureus]|uniref:RLA class II histocompatibility antigen, DP alpha-1 chain-like n=1 Tax=Oreochromis aureus TaxID=47969 RepID=UPI0012BD5830|nr:RLA class II histocompatibility antigen, DP alpha-1 chain-like [Oreochromis aureus]